MPPNSLAPFDIHYPADINSIDPKIWPASTRRALSGAIEVGNLSTLYLASRFETPLYVLDAADVRGRAARIRTAALVAAAKCGVRMHIYYAGKAFLCTAMARCMIATGLRIDVCSEGELAVVLAAGVDAGLVGFHGNNKSDSEISQAVEAGVGTLVIDCAEEVEWIAEVAGRCGRVQEVRLRVNTGVHASTHTFLATAHEDQKFGVPAASAIGVVERIRKFPALHFLGLHGHIGSQIFNSSGFKEAARILLLIHAELLDSGPVPELNIGGGFGIAHVSKDEPEPIEDILQSLFDTIANICSDLNIALPDLAIEPGRWIIGPAGLTLYTAGTIKDVPVSRPDGVFTRRYVSVDGGMSDNLRPALYGAPYSVRLAGRISSAEPTLVRVVGKHCEAGDIVVHADYLPGDVSTGDLLAVPATGAYCHSLASNYNMVPRPPVVAVSEGRATVIVTRETREDLLRRDPGITLGWHLV